MATAFPSARPSYGGIGTSDFQSQLVAASNQANTANQRRLDQAMSIYDEIIKRYQPGGTFGTAALGQLEAQKKKDVGKQTQGLISSGLYGTTTTTGLGKQWESDVGAPSRLKLEDIMMERLSGAQQNKASFIQGIQDVGPSLSDIYGMSQAGGGGGTISGGVQDTQPFGAYSAVNRGGGSTSGYGQSGGGFGGSGSSLGYGRANPTNQDASSFHSGPSHQQTVDLNWSKEDKARGYKFQQRSVPGHDEPQWVKVFPDGTWGI